MDTIRILISCIAFTAAITGGIYIFLDVLNDLKHDDYIERRNHKR